jgi:hypothetical protein
MNPREEHKTMSTRWARIASTVVVAAGLLLAVAADAPAKPSLDGRTFQVVTGKKGEKTTEPDTLVFQGGMFHSSGCDSYGFKPATYRTKTSGTEIQFEALAGSATEGENLWKGTVKGDGISGTFRWFKPGQSPIDYWFEGQLVKP